jgi:hypothetical protein
VAVRWPTAEGQFSEPIDQAIYHAARIRLGAVERRGGAAATSTLGAKAVPSLATALPVASDPWSHSATAPDRRSGGPAVGKTTTARALAETTEQCAYIDVDDVSQMIKNDGVAPWQGAEGRVQHVLRVRNAAALVAHFTDAGINVILSDVITQDLLNLYRDLVPELVAIGWPATFRPHGRGQPAGRSTSLLPSSKSFIANRPSRSRPTRS